MQISELRKKYLNKINSLDFDLILAHTLRKPKEFLYTHPEYKLNLKELLD